jgi:membrane protease YdiL (CAAX protease family)
VILHLSHARCVTNRADDGSLFLPRMDSAPQIDGAIMHIYAEVDPSPRSAARWIRYLGIAVAAWVLWMVFGVALGSFLKPGPAELSAIRQFLPHGVLEKLCWVAFAFGTNFCEEVLYRGHLLRQFRALTGSPTIALFLQTVVFAMGHLALGVPITISVSLLALWLGVLTLWQKSLLPAMIVHISISLFGGLASSP